MSRDPVFSLVIDGDRAYFALKRLGLNLSDLSGVFGEIAREAAEDARMFAPKRSGALAADVRPGKAKTKAVVYAGRVSVPYAGAINYGWRDRHIAASLFMQRAADDKGPSAAERIAAEIQRLSNQVGL